MSTQDIREDRHLRSSAQR